MSGFKRARADLDALTSAGLTMFNKDECYFSTSVTNLSLYDGTSSHGLPALYSQSRTTQIIPNTARSEVGVAYAEIHTKTLPIFQPQVKIGIDPNELIYEVGLSSTWTGCLINPSIYQSRMNTLLASDVASDAYINGTSRQTFQTVPGASGEVVDSYGNTFTVTFPSDVKHMLLSTLFDYWRLPASTLQINTPFTPVCVPSVYQQVSVIEPILDSVPTVLGAFIAVKSAEGFNVGDRVRVFGSVDSAAPSVKLNKYTTILSICLYSDLVVAGAIANPTSNDPSVLTMPCLVVDNTSTTGLNLASTVARKGGYVVNCQTDKKGGSIQFLTDEFEFKPLTITPTACTANQLTATLPTTVGVTSGEGFLRANWNGVVEVRATTESKLNGLYKVTGFSGSSPSFTVTLRPLTHVLDGSFSGTATLKLAPNGYTFTTAVSTFEDYTQFNNAVGFVATSANEIVASQYPPVASQPPNSWTRAYTPDFQMSSYRSVRWVTQDIAPQANPPTVTQDFGDGSASTYYNVYNMQTFLNECVNPAFESCLSELGGAGNLEDKSLQEQLTIFAKGYSESFTKANSTFLFSSSTSYASEDVCHYDGLVYIALAPTLGTLPTEELSVWLKLGDVKKEASTTTGDLVFASSTGGWSFTSVGATMLPERVTFARSPEFKSTPPRFAYNALEELFFYDADTYSFGNTYPFVDVKLGDGTFDRDPRNYNYKSWGYKAGCSGGDAQETFIMESNSAFKFLLDNFQCSAITYINPDTNDTLAYWLWPSYGDVGELEWRHRRFTQATESMSSCTSPVQSIVITSRTVPVVPSLASPATILSDFNAPAANLNFVSGDTDNIIAEFSMPPGGHQNSMRSVIRYQPDEVTYYSLQSTKTFKQLDYTVFYRHRITQKLVPLILSNYGNVNIKFVFKPI